MKLWRQNPTLTSPLVMKMVTYCSVHCAISSYCYASLSAEDRKPMLRLNKTVIWCVKDCTSVYIINVKAEDWGSLMVIL